MPHEFMPQDVLTGVRRYAAAGLVVVPVPPDGSKHPLVPWKQYQHRRPTDRELVSWFGSRRNGPAVLCGAVSGGLEVLDFDDGAAFAPWRALIDARAPGLLARLPVVRTPRPGYHVYLRCPSIAGNQKLAEDPGPDGRRVTLVETRGEGGLVLTPSCPPACHPSHRRYVMVQGDLTRVPVLTADERELLLAAARSLSRYRAVDALRPRAPAPDASSSRTLRRGDHINARIGWAAILEPHGWVCVGLDGAGVGRWRRPGKSGRGWSATTDYGGSGLLYVFSSNAAPFEPGRAYSKLAARALLSFGSDFRSAARSLTGQHAGGDDRRPLQSASPRHQVSCGAAGVSASAQPRSIALKLRAPVRPSGVRLAPHAGRRPRLWSCFLRRTTAPATSGGDHEIRPARRAGTEDRATR